MRGSDQRSGESFSYVDLEKRVRQDHPLRAVRELASAARPGNFPQGVPDSADIPHSAREEMLVAPFNDVGGRQITLATEPEGGCISIPANGAPAAAAARALPTH